MLPFVADPELNGLEVIDIQGDAAFAARSKHARSPAAQMHAMQRLARAFVDSPETILQELVELAVEMCGADSAGISVEKDDRTEQDFYHWVATAGEYSGFLDASLPRYPSACGICLERGRPQLFRVTKKFFDIMGIEAPAVTDGILLPWQVDETRGTIFVMAHGRSEAFDTEDAALMLTLADFAAMAVRHQRQQRELMTQTAAAAEAAVAKELAHMINNPLQSLTTAVYLSGENAVGRENKALVKGMAADVDRMSRLVKELLKLPGSQHVQ
jgi:transcriptional regulator with GAF, ATPase, and Fis domain